MYQLPRRNSSTLTVAVAGVQDYTLLEHETCQIGRDGGTGDVWASQIPYSRLIIQDIFEEQDSRQISQ